MPLNRIEQDRIKDQICSHLLVILNFIKNNSGKQTQDYIRVLQHLHISEGTFSKSPIIKRLNQDTNTEHGRAFQLLKGITHNSNINLLHIDGIKPENTKEIIEFIKGLLQNEVLTVKNRLIEQANDGSDVHLSFEATASGRTLEDTVIFEAKEYIRTGKNDFLHLVNIH